MSKQLGRRPSSSLPANPVRGALGDITNTISRLSRSTQANHERDALGDSTNTKSQLSSLTQGLYSGRCLELYICALECLTFIVFFLRRLGWTLKMRAACSLFFQLIVTMSEIYTGNKIYEMDLRSTRTKKRARYGRRNIEEDRAEEQQSIGLKHERSDAIANIALE